MFFLGDEGRQVLEDPKIKDICFYVDLFFFRVKFEVKLGL